MLQRRVCLRPLRAVLGVTAARRRRAAAFRVVAASVGLAGMAALALVELVLPCLRIVRALVGIEARKDAFEVFGVGEPLVDEVRRVRIVDDVFFEIRLVL